MKFAHKIILAVVAIVIVSLGSLSLVQYLNVKSSINRQIQSSIKATTLGIQKSIDNVLNKKMELAKYAVSLFDGNFSRENVVSIMSKPIMKQNFALVGMGYESDGKGVGNNPKWNPGSSWDARKRGWYMGAKEKKKSYITSPYEDSATKEILVSVVTPAINKNGFIGALFYDVKLDFLAKTVNAISLLDGAGYLFITTEDGTIIAHPDKTLNAKSLTKIDKNIKVGKKGEFEKNGKDYMVGFLPLESERWLVGYVIDKQKALKSVDNLKSNALMYTLIAVFLTILILYWLIDHFLKPLNNLNRSIQAIEGDLTQRLDTNTDKEFAELAKGFNLFIQRLQEQVKHTKVLGVRVQELSSQTNQNALDSCDAMDEQLRDSHFLVESMDKMSDISKSIEETANSANEQAIEVATTTISGEKIVAQTTDAMDTLAQNIDDSVLKMKELEESIGNIENVLTVIEEIADQTNLLALNAAIEAARAGEHGRGFAVVADEVRSLAERTQQSTTEIQNMIKHLQNNTNAMADSMKNSKSGTDISVKSAIKAKQSLAQIAQMVQKISHMITQMSNSSKEQTKASCVVDENVKKIQSISHVVAKNMKITSEHSKEQLQTVKEQEKLMDRFTV